MLEGIEGVVVERRESHLVIGVSGFRFRIYCTPASVESSPVGSSISLRTYLHFTQDRAPELYGFSGEVEYELFTSLLKVSKIGPKLAMKILSSASAERLRTMIASRDVSELSRVPGVGRKTAERLVTEISDLVGAGSIETSTEGFDQVEEAVNALVSLGFETSSARQMIRRVVSESESLSAQDLIREALKLSKKT